MASSNNIPETSLDAALLSWLQQFAPHGVFTLDASLRIRSWNHWMELHSSLTSAEVLGRELFEIYPDLERRKLRMPFQRALAGESSVLSSALHRYLLPFPSLAVESSDQMLQTARIAPLLYGKNVGGVIVVIEDVTQREIQAESLARQHRRDEILSWALVNLLKTNDPRKTVRQLFFKIAEQLDFDTFLLYLRDGESGVFKLFEAGGISDDLESKFREYEMLSSIANGSEAVGLSAIKSREEPGYALLKEAKISSAIAIPLRANEQSHGVLCFASWNRDYVTADESALLCTIAQYLATALDKENINRKLEKTEEAKQWMGAIVESSDDAIISKDLDGIIKSCNQGAAQLFGYEMKELIGKPMRMLVPADHQEEETQILETIRLGKRIQHFETIRQRKNGDLIEVSLMVSPVMEGSGKIVGASNIARDITARKQGEKALRKASRAKDDFLAALSHELRTPLNPALLIASECADNDQLPEGVRLNFETIRKNIELEASLIDDLLDLTRVTSGKMVLNKSFVDAHDILTDAIATTQAEQQEKKIRLDIHLDAPQSMVDADVVRLQQVFWNILKNAVKFTPAQGKITIETSVQKDSELLIRISDTGIGMNADEIERVFTAFAQGDHAGAGGSHRFGGLGLGLAISKNLVELHLGKITVQSGGKNQGAVFTVELPLAKGPTKKIESKAERQNKDEQSGRDCDNKFVLLVEDHEITRTVLAHLLSRRNYKVFTADSVAQAREIADQNKFDFLIADIGLPDGNGNDLMNELREKYGLKGIALTGYGMEDDIARGKAAGFVTHLIKPVRIQSLENALAIVKSQTAMIRPD